jgi:hypothetical protein
MSISILVVLYNSLDNTENDFIESIPSNVVKYDWYKDNIVPYLGPSVGQFPTVCMTVNPATADSDGNPIIPSPNNSVGLMVQPASWSDVVSLAAQSPNQLAFESIGIWGDYQGGSPLSPVKCFENAIFFDTSLSGAAQLLLPEVFPLLEENELDIPLVQEYWAKFAGSGELTSNDISIVEAHAATYGIPLVAA